MMLLDETPQAEQGQVAIVLVEDFQHQPVVNVDVA